MSAWAVTWLTTLILFIAVSLWSFRRGRKEADRDQMEGILDDLEVAQGIRRDVSGESRADLADELRKPADT
jgi:cbb3-type cytochrome oxidase subunit 3